MKNLQVKVGFLLDTKGPEIRTELFEGDAKSTLTKLVKKIRVAAKRESNQLVK